MYSKIHEKGSLSKFKKSVYGEAIIEFNDNPHTTLGVDNVFVFVTGTKTNPKINRVVRFQFETETEMEIIKEKLYERGSFSNTYYSFLKQYGLAREYSKKSSLDYTGYEEKIRRGSIRAEGDGTNGNGRYEQNGSRTFEETRSVEIEQRKKTSSTDGVFFDANKKAYSLWGTLIVVENSKYSAEVVVGITVAGDAVLYDVVNMTTVAFNIKKAEFSTTATTQNAIGDINENSTNTIISPNTPTVNKQLSLSEDNSGDVVDEVVCFRGGISPPAILTYNFHK